MIDQQFRSSEPSEKKYYKGEVNYIFLSMIAKSFLTWVIWYGSNRPTRDDLQIVGCED